MHVFLEDSQSIELGEADIDVPPKVTLGTDAQAHGEASGTEASTDGATISTGSPLYLPLCLTLF